MRKFIVIASLVVTMGMFLGCDDSDTVAKSVVECEGSVTKCENEISYQCFENTWMPGGNACVKSPEVVCTNGAVKCENDVSYTCSNNAWNIGGDVCKSPASNACTGDAKKCENGGVYTCSAGVWVAGNRCDNGCNAAGTDCNVPAAANDGCAAGTMKCESNVQYVCSSEQNWMRTADCPSGCDGDKCKTETPAPEEPNCTANAKKCENSTLYSCNAGNWVEGNDCPNGCNATNDGCADNTQGGNNNDSNVQYGAPCDPNVLTPKCAADGTYTYCGKNADKTADVEVSVLCAGSQLACVNVDSVDSCVYKTSILKNIDVSTLVENEYIPLTTSCDTYANIIDTSKTEGWYPMDVLKVVKGSDSQFYFVDAMVYSVCLSGMVAECNVNSTSSDHLKGVAGCAKSCEVEEMTFGEGEDTLVMAAAGCVVPESQELCNETWSSYCVEKFGDKGVDVCMVDLESGEPVCGRTCSAEGSEAACGTDGKGVVSQYTRACVPVGGKIVETYTDEVKCSDIGKTTCNAEGTACE